MKRVVSLTVTCPDCGGRGSSGVFSGGETPEGRLIYNHKKTWECETCRGRGAVKGDFTFDTDDPLKEGLDQTKVLSIT
jgi:DnaJ-class molecular chaperone